MLYPFSKKRKLYQGFGFTAYAKAHPELYATWGGRHPGWDIEAPIGLGARAVGSGRVKTGYSKGNGNYIVLTTKSYIVHYYHLKDFNKIKNGQLVGRGQFIAHTGNTGASTDPHLHIHWIRRSTGQLVNPSKFTWSYIN